MVWVTPCLTWTLSWSCHYGMCCPCSIHIANTLSWIFTIIIFLFNYQHKQCQRIRWDQNQFFHEKYESHQNLHTFCLIDLQCQPHIRTNKIYLFFQKIKNQITSLIFFFLFQKSQHSHGGTIYPLIQNMKQESMRHHSKKELIMCSMTTYKTRRKCTFFPFIYTKVYPCHPVR